MLPQHIGLQELLLMKGNNVSDKVEGIIKPMAFGIIANAGRGLSNIGGDFLFVAVAGDSEQHWGGYAHRFGSEMELAPLPTSVTEQLFQLAVGTLPLHRGVKPITRLMFGRANYEALRLSDLSEHRAHWVA